MPENAGGSSVSGCQVTVVESLAAALFDRQTPPPVDPRYTVFPEASQGAIAIDVTRPVTSPNCDVTI